MNAPANLHAAEHYNALARAEGWQSRCFTMLTFQRAEMLALLDIWRELERDAGGIPLRKDLTPQRLRAHLSDLGIYEKIAGDSGHGRYRARVMGLRFGTVLGNFTGKWFDEVVPPNFLKRWHAAPDAVLAARTPLRFISRSETSQKAHVTGEYLMCPLIGDDGTVNTVLSAAIFGATVSGS